VAAPLPQFSFAELFALYADSCGALRDAWRAHGTVTSPLGIRLRAILQTATRSDLECFSARLSPPWPAGRAVPRTAPRPTTDPVARLADAAASPGLLGGRLASVLELLSLGRVDLARTGLAPLVRDGVCPVAVDYLRAELALQTGDSATALELTLGALRS